MTLAALLVTLVVRQTDGGEPSSRPEDEAVVSARGAVESMRDALRAVEHGLQEATGLQDTRAYECVTAGHLAIAQKVQSAEESLVMLQDAVAAGDAPLASRLTERIAGAERAVRRRLSEVSTCKLTLEPAAPVLNRSWFGCDDAPPSAQNPRWRACERRRGSAFVFALEGLLLAMPFAGFGALSGTQVRLADYADLSLASLLGGLAGGLALFAVTGGAGLAVSEARHEPPGGRLGLVIGVGTALGVGAGSLVGMYLDRPNSGGLGPAAAAASYVVIAGLSAVLLVLIDHLSVASSDDGPSLAEASLNIAPVLMALSAGLTVPAAWAIGMRH